MLLKNIIQKSAPKAFGKRGFAERKLLLEWPKIVGSELAACCMPQKISRDRQGKRAATLHLDVLSGFTLDVQQMEPVILEKISTYIGYRAIERLVLHQTYFLPQPEVYNPKAEPREDSLAAAHNQTAEVEDKDLRAALDRLGARIKEKEESLESAKGQD